MNIERKGIYMHGPQIYFLEPTHYQLIHHVFPFEYKGRKSVIGIQIQTTLPRKDTWQLNGALYRNKYVLMGHPWGGFSPLHIKYFEDNHDILGSIICFKWFRHQYYRGNIGYRDNHPKILRAHLEIGFADGFPVAVLIDSSPPKIQPQIKEFDGGYIVVDERPAEEELLSYYKASTEADIATFIDEYDLAGKAHVAVMDITQIESVDKAMWECIQYLEG